MSEKAKIYCFTKYSPKGPSSRYRTFQYLEFWKLYYNIEVNILLDDWYFEKGLNIFVKGAKIITSFLKRFRQLNKITKKDLVWIEYELFPYLGIFAEKKLKKTKIPFILDYDDAIFHGYDQHRIIFFRNFLGSKIGKIMSLATFVITGSPYLTSYAEKWNKNVLEIPTSIKTEEYDLQEPHITERNKETFIIGWLGSSPTSINLDIIKDAFIQFTKESNAELWLMGYDETLKHTWATLPVKFFSWSSQKEKSFLNSIDVGIMPLFDNPYNHGKCGFKLIQYMAMGKPTISTPLEANIKIDRSKLNYFATHSREWLDGFRLVQKEITKQTFVQNRIVVKNFYSTNANASRYLTVFNQSLEKQ